MKMKFKKFSLVFVSFLLLLSGCGRFAYIENEETTSKEETRVSFHETDNVAFIKEPPAQFCSSKDGIYHLVVFSESEIATKKLYFYDFKTGIDTIVCSKIDCEHNDNTCVSYYEDNSNYYDFYIYNDSIFKLITEENGIYLYKYDKTGLNYERFALLYDNNIPCNIVLGRQIEDFLYYKCLTEDGTLHICKVNLETGKYSELCQLDGNYYSVNASRILEKNQCIYLEASHYPDNELETYKEVVYKVDLNTNLKEEICETYTTDSQYATINNVSIATNDSDVYALDDKNNLINLIDGKVIKNFSDLFKLSEYGIFANNNYILFNKNYMEYFMSSPIDSNGEKTNIESDTNIYLYDITNDKSLNVSNLNIRFQDETGKTLEDCEMVSILGLTDEYCYIYGDDSKLYMLDLSTIYSDEVLVIRLDI